MSSLPPPLTSQCISTEDYNLVHGILVLITEWWVHSTIPVSDEATHCSVSHRMKLSKGYSNYYNLMLFPPLWSHVVLFVLHSIAVLWPSEWEVISRLFIVDQPISIHCFKETTSSGPTTQYTTQPGKSAASYMCSCAADQFQVLIEMHFLAFCMFKVVLCSNNVFFFFKCYFNLLSEVFVYLFRSVLGLQRELPFPAAEGPQRIHPSNCLHSQSH